MKKGFINARLATGVALVVTSVATTVFQPLAYLGATAAPAQQAGCQTFRETGKTVCGRFLQYWQQNGGLPQQGFPISNEFREKSDLDGKEYTVQYFERAVFEMHPENKAPYDVLLSQLGTFRFRAKYPNGEPGAPPPTPVPPPPPGVGVQVPLPREGVTIELFEVKILPSLCDHAAVEWAMRVRNTGAAPYTITVDKTNSYMVDSTGKRYPLLGGPSGSDYCNFVGALFPSSTAAPGVTGFNAEGRIRFLGDNVPPQATYLDMRLMLSGTPLTFRYPLR